MISKTRGQIASSFHVSLAFINHVANIPDAGTSNPLADIESEDIVCIGLVVLAAILVIILGAFNHKLETAVSISLLSSLFLIALIVLT